MQDLNEAWHKLLDKHSQLLDNLNFSLKKERKALLSNDISLLKESSLLKEKATRQVLQVQDQIKTFKQDTAKRLNSDESLSLQELFSKFEEEFRSPLLKKRHQLEHKAHLITKFNKFNSRCLDTYRDFVKGIRTIYSMCKPDEYQIYDSGGQAYNREGQGKLVSRSL